MIEFNKPYLYKNKTVFPAIIENGNIICFDSKGATIFVKSESLLTKIDEKPKIVEPNYVDFKEVKAEPVAVVEKKEEAAKIEAPIEEPVIEKVESTPIVEEPRVQPVEEKDTVIEQDEVEGYDDFYDVKIPSVKKRKRVNIIEKNNYI